MLLCYVPVMSLHHVSGLYSCVMPLSWFCVIVLCHAPVMFLCRIPVLYPCHVSVTCSCVMTLSCFWVVFLCHTPVMFLCHIPVSCPCHAVVQVWWILAGVWFVYYSVITLFIHCNECDLAAFCERGIWDHLHVFLTCFAKLWSETCQILQCDCGVKGLKKMMPRIENRVFVCVV